MLKEEDTEHGKKQTSPDATMMAMPAAPDAAASEGRASLVIVAGGEIGREHEVRKASQIIGRSLQADIVVSAPSVSRQHARVDCREEDGVHYHEITDLGSSNGTFVDNQRVVTARLSNGARVAVGDVIFKFVIEDEVEARYHQSVHRLINYDQLTGLLTMEAFRRRLDMHLHRSGPGTTFCLAMTDLDGLKKVNDTHGHLAGRTTVQEMGAMMRACLRDHDVAGLYGGDEAIILFEDASLDEAEAVAEKIRTTIESRELSHHGNTFRVTISQGLAEWPTHGETAEALIAAADRALYAAKAAGRNRVVRCDRM